jgi:hypothetical protein
VNGIVVPQGTPYWVTQAQLAQTSFVAGAAGVADTLGMIAYDGQAYSGNGVWSKTVVTVSGTNSAPHMSLPNGAAVLETPNQPIAISSLFTATDLDGDSLTYLINDTNTAAGHGHFVVAGTVVPQATPYWVTQAQLAQTTYVAGANGVTETVGMIAYDGQVYSNGGVWTGVTVLADSAPQMTLPSGSSVSSTAGQSLAITSLFSATDADGDSLVYLINASTTTAGHGHFVVAGTVVPQGTPYWVTQAQLAQTSFVVGTAGVADTVGMIAYDGKAYSGGGVWSGVSIHATASSAPSPQAELTPDVDAALTSLHAFHILA